MATFKFGRAIDLHWNGYDIQGPAETVFSIPDQLYEEFDADIAPVEPTLVWIDTNEFSTLQNSVVTSTIIGSSYISVASTTAGTQLSLKSGAATNGYVLTADGAGGQAYQAAPGGAGALSAVIGTSPLSVITSAGTATVSIDSSIITSENAARMRTYVRNTTASTIAKGSVVYLDGSNGTVPSIKNALANADATSARTFGIVEADIATNTNGYVTNQGLLSPLNTSGVADGDVLWLSPTVAGAFTTTKPAGPNHGVLVGIVVKGTSVGAGSIYVLIKNGAELDEIHDVNITSPVTGQSIIWSSTASVWQNALIGSASISASAVTSGHISTGAVGSAALAANAVVAAAISAGAVGTAALATGAVTDAKIAANAVTSGHILAGAVGTAALATGAVTSIKIAAGAVDSAALGTGAVTSAKISAGAVDTAALGTGAVLSAKIAAGAVDTAALGTAAVISAKIAASAVTSGHIAAGAVGTAALATGAVTSAAIAASAVTSGHIAAGAVGTAALATGAVTTIKIAAGAVDSAALGTGAVTAAKIAASAVTSGHISAASVGTAAISSGAATSGQLLQANGSGGATFATITTGVQIYTTVLSGTGTWLVPTGVKRVELYVTGAGGGGASGSIMASLATVANGAGAAGGGGGGSSGYAYFPELILPSGSTSISYSVATGGNGGAAKTYTAAEAAVKTLQLLSGNNGSAGSGATTFGSILTVAAGSGGIAGNAVTTTTITNGTGGAGGDPGSLDTSSTVIFSGYGLPSTYVSLGATGGSGGNTGSSPTSYYRNDNGSTFLSPGSLGLSVDAGYRVGNFSETSGIPTSASISKSGAGSFTTSVIGTTWTSSTIVGGGSFTETWIKGGGGGGLVNRQSSNGFSNNINASTPAKQSSGGGGGVGAVFTVATMGTITATAQSGQNGMTKTGSGGGGGGGVVMVTNNSTNADATGYALTSGAGGNGSDGVIIIRYTA